MPQVIHKFKVDIGYRTALGLPQAALIVSVAQQGADVLLWVQVDTSAPKVERVFLTVGTGHELPELPNTAYCHVGTVHDTQGFVWHIFEECKYANKSN